MTVGSLFSGIGGFDAAAERLGMRVLWQSEIDRFASRVLAARFPTVPNYGDITQIDGAALPPVDLLVGGWPCQGNSIAGKRQGHADERSGLFSEILRLIDGMDPRPRFLCLENVPGLVSVSEGRDFAHCIGELRRRGYVGCVRRLDAQHFGLAQRRARLFFVCGLGAEGLRAVQLVLEGGRRYPAPSREARPELARDVAAGLRWGGKGERGWSFDAEHGLTTAYQCHGSNVGPAGTLRQGNGNVTGGVPFVAGGVTARYGKGTDSDATDTLIAHPLLGRANSSHDESLETYVTHTLRGEGFDASEDGTGRGTPQVASLAVAFNWQGGGNQGDLDANGERTGALQAETVPAVAFTERTRDGERQLEAQPELAYALDNPGEGGRTQTRQVMTPAARVRRLTPTECEILQGFPIGHTCLCGRNEGRSVGEDPCTCPDGPRYRGLGNAVALNPVLWVLGCIAAASEAAP